jgi:hypothetical protein
MTRTSLARLALFPSLLLSLLLSASTARGAPRTTAAPTAGSDAALRQKLARALYPRERWRRAVQAASDDMAAKIAARGTGSFELSPEFKDRLREQYERLMPYEELVGYQARILAGAYSTVELYRLLAFYRSPTGQKSLAFVDALVRDADQQLQIALLQRLPGALANLRPLVRQLDEAGATGTASADPRWE